jgi:proline iminopeptidase
MSSVTVDGVELHYTVRGQGPWCLVPCAIGAAHYELLTAGLTDRFTIVCLDMRASGRSGGQASDVTFELLAADFEAVRRHVGAERWAVLGYSIVGAVAIEYGRRCPETVSHVIAAGTPPNGDMAGMVTAGMAYVEREASAERKRLFAENMARLPPGTDPRQAVPAQTPLRFYDAPFDVTPLYAVAEVKPPFFAQLMGSLTASWDVTAGELRVPLLVAHGKHDYVVPHTMWADVLPRLPSASFVLFERSGHQPFFEEPERFGQVMSEWMGKAAAGLPQ